MNVPEIRKALERLASAHVLRHDDARSIKFMDAVVRVGLRACDEATHGDCDGVGCKVCDAASQRLEVIADILREAGVEVEG